MKQGDVHARSAVHRHHARVFRARHRLRRRVRAPGVTQMTLDYVVGLIVTAGLLVYLTYALLRPEKF